MPLLWDLFSLFPAYAGVIPKYEKRVETMTTFPRLRGGDPQRRTVTMTYENFSPPMRG